MNPKRKNYISLKTKLGAATGITVFITVAVLTSYLIISSRNTSAINTKNRILLLTEKSGLEVGKKIDETMLKIEDHISYSMFLRQTPGDHREKLYEYYKKDMESNPSFQGVSLVFAPGKFDNLDSQYAGIPGYYTDGRLCVYWYRQDGQIKRETQVVNFDEELATSGSDYWLKPIQTKKSFMSIHNYKWKGKNILMLSLFQPILLKDEAIGVMGYAYEGGFLQEQALKIKQNIFDGHCDVNIVTEDGTFAANTINDSLILKNIRNYYPESSKLITGLDQNATDQFFTENDTLYLSTPVQFSDYSKKWRINVAVPISVVMSEVNKKLKIQLLAGLALIIASIIIIVVLITRLIKPLIILTSAANEISGGKLNVNIDLGQNDEIGQLSVAFKIMIEKLRDIVSGIQTGALLIVDGSSHVSASAQTISEGASEQASATEEVSSSIEEVLTAISQNADNAREARQISKKAESGIADSQKASLTTIEAMKKITGKTSIITQIAKQTNILAINAAIEAARAGQLGRGFGIVAGEVRNLAELSHQAAADIVQLSGESLQMSEIAGQTLLSIVPDMQKTVSLIEEITTASMEQNSGVQQISKAIEQLNSVTLRNSATSEELASSSEELAVQAENLKQAISFFTLHQSEEKEKHVRLEITEKPVVPELKVFEVQTEEKKIINPVKKDTKGFNIDLDTKTDEEFEAF